MHFRCMYFTREDAREECYLKLYSCGSSSFFFEIFPKNPGYSLYQVLKYGKRDTTKKA